MGISKVKHKRTLTILWLLAFALALNSKTVFAQGPPINTDTPIMLGLEGIYDLNTSQGQVDFGDSFLYNLTLGYRLLPVVYETYPSPQLNGFLELNGAQLTTDWTVSIGTRILLF